eukprot:scaffold26731_cov246-Skeletonema_menzelii.AAC.1
MKTALRQLMSRLTSISHLARSHHLDAYVNREPLRLSSHLPPTSTTSSIIFYAPSLSNYSKQIAARKTL